MCENYKEKAYTSLGKHLCGELIDHQGPIPDFYNRPLDIDEKVWIAYPSCRIDHVGTTRAIVISKKTGEILADVMVGE